MIDIIEAGKFYLECLKKVQESILKENVLPQNTILNAKADLFCFCGPNDKRIIGAFELNGVNHTFEVGVGLTDSKRDIMYNISLRIADVVAKAIINQISLEVHDETTQD